MPKSLKMILSALAVNGKNIFFSSCYMCCCCCCCCCCCQVASVMSDSVRPHRRQPTRLPHPWDSLGKNTGVGCHFLLQSMKVNVKVIQSCQTLCDPMAYTVHGTLQARLLEWVFSLLQGIFPTQGSNPSLPHCRQIPYQLSHKGSPRILEWVAYPFSSGSS